MKEKQAQKFSTFRVLDRSYDLPLSNSGCTLTKEKILMEATVLFATQGYAGISIRDIAERVFISPGALYNHFRSKEELFDAILNHACDLYLIYYKHMEEDLQSATCFEDVIDILFTEALQMRNMYTNYAFSLIIVEQFHHKRASEIYNEIFFDYSVSFIEKWFKNSIDKGWAKPFPCKIEAQSILNTVMISILNAVSKSLGNPVTVDCREVLLWLKERLIESYRLDPDSSDHNNGRVV